MPDPIAAEITQKKQWPRVGLYAWKLMMTMERKAAGLGSGCLPALPVDRLPGGTKADEKRGTNIFPGCLGCSMDTNQVGKPGLGPLARKDMALSLKTMSG